MKTEEKNMSTTPSPLNIPTGQIGATGNFPEGKLNEADEGELSMAVAIRDGKVIVDFGKPVVWFGMDAKQATGLGRLLIEKANDLKNRS